MDRPRKARKPRKPRAARRVFGIGSSAAAAPGPRRTRTRPRRIVSGRGSPAPVSRPARQPPSVRIGELAAGREDLARLTYPRFAPCLTQSSPEIRRRLAPLALSVEQVLTMRKRLVRRGENGAIVPRGEGGPSPERQLPVFRGTKKPADP